MKTKSMTYQIKNNSPMSCDASKLFLTANYFWQILIHDGDQTASATKRKKKEDFLDQCVRLDTFFATLSHLLESLASANNEIIRKKIVRETQNDLNYLQRNYVIKPRKESDNIF